MAAWVKSIQIADGNFTGTSTAVSMTEGQIPANCFCRLSTQINNFSDASDDMVSALVEAGPDQVTLERALSGGSIDYTLVIIEVEPTQASVQQVEFDLTGASTTQAISAVTLANAFFTGYCREQADTGDDFNATATEVYFSSTTQLTAEREDTAGGVTCVGWVVSTSTGAFSVQTVDVDAETGAIADLTLSAVTMAEVMTFFSYQVTEVADDSDQGAVTGELTSTTNYRLERVAASTTNFSGTAFVVEMDDASSVQRVEFSFDFGTGTTVNETISAVDLDRSMAHGSQGTGGFGCTTGRSNATAGTGLSSNHAEFRLTTSTNAQGQVRTVTINTTTQPVEVVEFELAVAPPDVDGSYAFVA